MSKFKKTLLAGCLVGAVGISSATTMDMQIEIGEPTNADGVTYTKDSGAKKIKAVDRASLIDQVYQIGTLKDKNRDGFRVKVEGVSAAQNGDYFVLQNPTATKYIGAMVGIDLGRAGAGYTCAMPDGSDSATWKIDGIDKDCILEVPLGEFTETIDSSRVFGGQVEMPIYVKISDDLTSDPLPNGSYSASLTLSTD
jgi:hypothetical protein